LREDLLEEQNRSLKEEVARLRQIEQARKELFLMKTKRDYYSPKEGLSMENESDLRKRHRPPEGDLSPDRDFVPKKMKFEANPFCSKGCLLMEDDDEISDMAALY
jgi:hypothetical protein